MMQTYLRETVAAQVVKSFGNFKPGDTIPINRVVRSDEGGFVGVRGQDDLLPPTAIDKVSRRKVVRQFADINSQR